MEDGSTGPPPIGVDCATGGIPTMGMLSGFCWPTLAMGAMEGILRILLILSKSLRSVPGVREVSSRPSALHSTSISNLRLSLRSCSWCSSASKFRIPVVQGFGCLKTLLLAQDSTTLAMKGTTYISSCCPLWKASMMSGLKSSSRIRMGLFRPRVIRPSQWPRFLRRDRSEKLAMLLSLPSSTLMEPKVSSSTKP